MADENDQDLYECGSESSDYDDDDDDDESKLVMFYEEDGTIECELQKQHQLNKFFLPCYELSVVSREGIKITIENRPLIMPKEKCELGDLIVYLDGLRNRGVQQLGQLKVVGGSDKCENPFSIDMIPEGVDVFFMTRFDMASKSDNSYVFRKRVYGPDDHGCIDDFIDKPYYERVNNFLLCSGGCNIMTLDFDMKCRMTTEEITNILWNDIATFDNLMTIIVLTLRVKSFAFTIRYFDPDDGKQKMRGFGKDRMVLFCFGVNFHEILTIVLPYNYETFMYMITPSVPKPARLEPIGTPVVNPDPPSPPPFALPPAEKL